MQENVEFSVCEDGMCARLFGEVDHHTAKSIREKIDKMLFLEKPKVCILDFSAVTFMDSAGLGLILGRAECAAAIGARIHVRALSKTPKKLVTLSGIEKIKNLSIG